MISGILSILSAVFYLYALLCLANVLLSWIPGLKFTAVGKFISKVTDPYMNFFSRRGIFRIGNIDFSPIVSLGILTLISTILANIQRTGKIFIGGIIATIFGSLWGIVQSLCGLLFLLILIRWIVLLSNHGVTPYDSIWTRFDQILNRMVYKISGVFYKKPINYQNALLISWIALLVFEILGTILISIITGLLYKMPI
ncbi:MAG: YggT family protein [Treponema sp.]|nr:YggT family protein [Treponema sp.]